MSTLARRAHDTVRDLRRAPGFTMPVVVALAIGIGFGVPILGGLRGAALRPSPYTDPLLQEGRKAMEWLPGWTAARQSIAEIQDASLNSLLGVLLALTLLLLAIALINLLTLLLARAAVQRREVALRAVLGAAQRRLVGGLLGEAASLLLLGSALGLLIGSGIAVLLQRSWPGQTPPWRDLGVDRWIVAAVIGAFMLVPLLAWLSPAAVAWRGDLRQFLTTGARSTADPKEILLRQVLAVVQVAASLVLLTSAGLLLRGFVFPVEESRGLSFDTRDTLTVQVRLPESQRKGVVFYQGAHDRIDALPGVVSASAATTGAWLGLGAMDRVTTVCSECSQGTMYKPVSTGPARIHAVSPGFFEALGAPVLRGRELEPNDKAGAARVAVINTAFAYRLFPNGEPLGKSIQIGGRDGEWYGVVGVVPDIRAPGIGPGAEPVPALYLSVLQHPPSVVNLAVRTTGDPMRLLPGVEEVVHSLAPEAMLANAMTMEQYLARFCAPLRWFAVLFGVLAGVALLLATTGLQGAMSYNVARRTREIGIRMALGARIRDITRMVIGQSLRITGVATIIGLIGALSLARLLQLLLHGVELFDPLLFGGVAVLLGSVALLASHRPAGRAASVDPQISLRAE